MKVRELVDAFQGIGYQSVELNRASEVIVKMKKNNAKIYLTFTSNMVTSGLRGFFAQLIKLKIADVIVTTVGGIEEDIMKASGEKFSVGSFGSDDVELHEQGINRVGNILINNESYMNFEDWINPVLTRLYEKQKRWTVSELLKEIGLQLDDENSILYQAAKNDIPIYCPGIADSSFGFQLFMFQQKNPDFIVDTIKDMERIVTDLSFDDKKGLISLGGSTSKHYAIFAALLSGGFDYAVYMTTSHSTSGSLSGATTQEAKSWGKLKDDAEAATVNGDVCITFPLMMTSALDKMKEESLLNG
jgi:deoxyhypusine synthase